MSDFFSLKRNFFGIMMERIWKSPDAYNPYYLDHPKRLVIKYHVTPLPTGPTTHPDANGYALPVTESLARVFESYMREAGFPNKIPASTKFDKCCIFYEYNFPMKQLNKERIDYLWTSGYTKLRKGCYDLGFICVLSSVKSVRLN